MMWGAIKYAERPQIPSTPMVMARWNHSQRLLAHCCSWRPGQPLDFTASAKLWPCNDRQAGSRSASFTLVVLVGAIFLKEGLFRWVSLRAKAIGKPGS